MTKVAILGASGYTGTELIRLVLKHSQLELVAVSSEKYAHMPVQEVFPAFSGVLDLTFHPLLDGGPLESAEYVFLALPHKKAMEVVPSLIKKGKKVVDLSADFRFRNPAPYEQYYQKHNAPELLGTSVYGLTEIYRDKIRTAQLIANPGCDSTAALLSLIPAVKNDLIDLTAVIIDAKSGASGAVLIQYSRHCLPERFMKGLNLIKL